MNRFLCVALLACTLGCSRRDEELAPQPAGTDYWEKTKDIVRRTREQGGDLLGASTNETWDAVRSLYDRARAAGDQVPSNVVEWARQDIGRMGTWQYRIVDVPGGNPDNIVSNLDALGRERWECYWVETTGDVKRLYLKKAGRSYLRTIPLGDMLKLMPDIGGP